MPRWQRPHTGPFAGFVVVCVLDEVSESIHGAGECGEKMFTPWQPAVFRQVWFARPPVKSDPWQSWQVENPVVCALFGKDLAEAPCESGDAQPAGCPEGPLA